jgi:RNA polymerase sigma factor (sigma-70 family)
MTNEEHGQEFLQFVAKNEARLKKNLQKNITYNPDIFDDVFQESIVKVYNAIENGARIKDFEQYFFIASKFCYINTDNKVKARQKTDDRDAYVSIDEDERFAEYDNAWQIKEDRNERINELMKYLSQRLNDVFSPKEADIFLIYYRLKSEKAGVSYKKLAKILEIDVKEVTNIIQRVKKWVKEDNEIIETKRKLMNGVN